MAVHSTAKALMVGIFTGMALLTGCGGEADGSGSSDPAANPTETQDTGSDPSQGVEDQQGSGSGGTATLTVGGDVYSFDTVRCAIGFEATGSNDYDFSLSAIQDGLQLSVDRGPTYSDNIELDDIEDFENPSVAWGAQGDDFLTINGSEVSGKTTFVDKTDETRQKTAVGKLVASCP